MIGRRMSMRMSAFLIPVLTFAFKAVNVYIVILIDQLNGNIRIIVFDHILSDDIADVVCIP
jgi:hypothetical protein